MAVADVKGMLLFDGAGIMIPPGTVLRFLHERHEELNAVVFREICCVSHPPGGVIRRLYPEV